MADPSKRSRVAALKVAFDEPAWNGWYVFRHIFLLPFPSLHTCLSQQSMSPGDIAVHNKCYKSTADSPFFGRVRQYQRIFVDRKVQDDHRHVERRIAFEQLFKLGDTPQVTMQNVLKLQASHYTEDQNIGMDRYKQNLHADRLFFIYLVSCEHSETAGTNSLEVRL